MAYTDYKSSPQAGFDFYSVDSTQKHPTCYIAQGVSPTHGAAEFIYLKGVANTAEGVVVTYDEAGVTTLLAANAKGPVAFALGATVANTWGWYQIRGKAVADCAASSADNATVGREGADGQIGDGRAAGDEICGVIARSATDTPASGLCWVQIFGTPFVNDFTGA